MNYSAWDKIMTKFINVLQSLDNDKIRAAGHTRLSTMLLLNDLKTKDSGYWAAKKKDGFIFIVFSVKLKDGRGGVKSDEGTSSIIGTPKAGVAARRKLACPGPDKVKMNSEQ